jgi:hypothetical protein
MQTCWDTDGESSGGADEGSGSNEDPETPESTDSTEATESTTTTAAAE